MGLMWSRWMNGIFWAEVWIEFHFGGLSFGLLNCLFLFLILKRVHNELLCYESFFVNFADFQIQNIRLNGELFVVLLKELSGDRACRVESRKWIDDCCCCVQHPVLIYPSLPIEYQFLLVLLPLPPLRLLAFNGKPFCQLYRNKLVKTLTADLTS